LLFSQSIYCTFKNIYLFCSAFCIQTSRLSFKKMLLDSWLCRSYPINLWSVCTSLTQLLCKTECQLFLIFFLRLCLAICIHVRCLTLLLIFCIVSFDRISVTWCPMCIYHCFYCFSVIIVLTKWQDQAIFLKVNLRPSKNAKPLIKESL